MKILRLRFKNINSFYGEHPAIDFTLPPLSETGLFIISGPTGAGKSTLLDVITLALFNRVPRFPRATSQSEIDKLGSIVNLKSLEEPRAEAYAEVEYEVKSGQYRAKWSISKNRNGNWNNYQMEIADLATGDLLELKKLSDYPEKNAELIGLNYDQFIKSIVLAQGSFAEFLKADKHTRGQLLEDITGTHIYREIGKAAYQKEKDSADQLVILRSEMKGVQLLSAEQLHDYQGKIAEKGKERDRISEEKAGWEAEKNIVSRLAEIEQRLGVLASQQLDVEKEAEAFKSEEAKLVAHESVSEFAADIREFRLAQKQLAELGQTSERLEKDKQSCHEEKRLLIERARQLTGKQELPESSLVGALENFEELVKESEQEIRLLREKGADLAARAKTEVLGTDNREIKSLPLNDFERSLAIVRALVKEQKPIAEMFSAGFDAEARLEELNTRENTLIRLNGLLDNLAKVKKRGETIAIELKSKEKDLEPRILKVDQLRVDVANLQNLIDQKSNRLLEDAARLSLNQYKETLKPGAPCPLCGSTHHPDVHEYVSKVSGLAVEIENLKKQLEEGRSADKKNSAEVQSLNDGIARLKREVQQLRDEYKGIQSDIGATAAAIGAEKNITAEQVEGEDKKITEEQQRIRNWKAAGLILLATDRLVPVFEELIQLKKEALIKKEALAKMYAGENVQRDVNLIASGWERVLTLLSQNEKQIQDNKLLIEKDRERLNEKHKSIMEQLLDKQVDSVEVAESKILTASIYNQLIITRQRLRERKQSILTQQTTLKEDQLQQSGQRKFSSLTREEVTNRAMEITAIHLALVAEVSSIDTILKEDTEKRDRFAALEKQIQDLQQNHKKWELLRKLIGDREGNNFSNFAQGITLANLIGLANNRLAKLTDRYLLDKPRNDSDSLFVLDVYLGNAPRAVSTLSGGETFTISLALALALSDLASRNVRIESLFIDEGFGTLDPESLETAITALENLQNESQKVVGVISHRSEMKDRIPVQIQVDKGIDGNSVIQVIG